MAVWAAAFRRQAVWAACREDLTTDDEAERPITNRVVEKKCANSLTLVSVLHEHASRPDDKVCLFIKVVAAATNIHSKVNAAASFLNLIPTVGMSLPLWAVTVKKAADKSAIDNWPLCLAKFEGGCTINQKAHLSLKHRDCRTFGELIALCQTVATPEEYGAAAPAASPSGGRSPNPRDPNSSKKECYNCHKEGHFSGDCPEPFTDKSYAFWSKKPSVSDKIKRKLREYEKAARRNAAKAKAEKSKKKLKGKGTAVAHSASSESDPSWEAKTEETSSDSIDEVELYEVMRRLYKEDKKRSNKEPVKYVACPSIGSETKSLARRAGTINGRTSYNIIFDTGASRSIVSDKMTRNANTKKVEPYRVMYGGGDTETMTTMVLVTVISEGKKLEVWAYRSSRLPFDILIGEDFLEGRAVIDYVNHTISFPNTAASAGAPTLPSIPPFPWGKGKPRAELLHRNSSTEEQDAVLKEELKVLSKIKEPRIRVIVEKYIRLFHEANKWGWAPSRWTPYELEWTGEGKSWTPTREYFYTKEKQDFILNKLAMWRARGFADFSDSEFCLPVVCAPKPQPADEEFRAAINFQQTNRFTVKSDYPMPVLEDIYKKVKGDTFSAIDGEEGYHKCRMAEKSVHFNSLEAVGVRMSCKGMMEGMKNAGNHYQKCSDEMLRRKTDRGSALDNFANGYVDDTLVYSEGMDKHVAHLEDVLGRMYEDNVKPKWRKAQFAVDRVVFGGRIVSKHGVEIIKDRAEVIRNLRRPRGATDVQKVFGLFLWHKQWIDHFDAKAKPITRFLKGKWKHRVIKWDEEAERAYLGLCQDIERATVRSRPGPGTIHIHTDWCQEAVAFHYYREHKGKRFPMGYGGRTLRGSELNWRAPQGELYAMAYACRTLKKDCVGREVVLHTDHIAWSDLKVKTSNETLVGYLMDILEVAPTSVYVKGVANTVADTITRLLQNVKPGYASVASGTKDTRTVVPPELRRAVIQEAHEGAIGGHYGTTSTLRIIAKKYKPWSGITKEVEGYQCQHCDKLKPIKGRYANRAGKLQAYSVNRPWQLVGIDIETTDGGDGKTITWLYVIDFFSKFAEAIMMNSKTTAEVVRALLSSTAWAAGVPERMTGDVDPAFTTSDEFRKFLTSEGVEWTDKDAHHHEGVVERGVATFKYVLEAKIAEGCRGRVALRMTGAAVNRGHVAFSTGFTPHSLVYGREFVSALQRRIMEAAKNMNKAADTRAKYFNRGKTEPKFEVGEKVLVRDPRPHVPRGDPKFLGPFRIVRAKGHSYSLLNKFTGRVYRRNVKDLRRPSFVTVRDTGDPENGGGTPQESSTLPKITDQPSPVSGDALSPSKPLRPTSVTSRPETPKPTPILKSPAKKSPQKPMSDADLVGRRVKVKWSDGNWYNGTVVKTRNNQHGSHDVKYDPDHSGNNEEPIYENLTGNSRARVERAEWALLPEGNNHG